MTISWGLWPVVSERFGCMLGTVQVPGDPAAFEPHFCGIIPLGPMEALMINDRVRWDPVGRRYIAPVGFPLNRLKTFQQL